jgi:hypothetical protein
LLKMFDIGIGSEALFGVTENREDGLHAMSRCRTLVRSHQK